MRCCPRFIVLIFSLHSMCACLCLIWQCLTFFTRQRRPCVAVSHMLPELVYLVLNIIQFIELVCSVHKCWRWFGTVSDCVCISHTHTRNICTHAKKIRYCVRANIQSVIKVLTHAVVRVTKTCIVFYGVYYTHRRTHKHTRTLLTHTDKYNINYGWVGRGESIQTYNGKVQ